MGVVWAMAYVMFASLCSFTLGLATAWATQGMPFVRPILLGLALVALLAVALWSVGDR